MIFRLVLPLLALCAALPALAGVITLGAAKDNALFAPTIASPSNANASNGGGPLFFAGTDGNGAVHRGLLAFDLSGIPTGSTITNVQLTLTLGQVAGGTGVPASATVGLFSLTRNWGEGTVSSVSLGSTGTSGAGSGGPANAGDATWNAAAFPGTLWTTAGGDHAAAASTSLALPTTSTPTASTWTSTPQLVADVQGWLDNPATNSGWELINADEVGSKTIRGFFSREWHNYTAAGGTASQEPALQVTFTAPVPEPTCGLLLGCGAFALLSRRRRT